MPWDHGHWCAALEAEGPRLVEVASASEEAAPVPSCPGWDVARLARHVGQVHRWAEALVRDGRGERIDPRQLDLGWPEDWALAPAWLADGTSSVVATLRGADPEAHVWTWALDQRVRFWSRRLLHETTVHRTDFELVAGRPPEIDAEVAADGIDELLEILPARASSNPALAELRGEGETIHLHATDGPGEWVISLEPDGFRTEHGHLKATAAVQARAGDLLLLLYRRLPLEDDRYRLFGDDGPVRHWLSHTAF